jgi:hypothetical protein
MACNDQSKCRQTVFEAAARDSLLEWQPHQHSHVAWNVKNSKGNFISFNLLLLPPRTSGGNSSQTRGQLDDIGPVNSWNREDNFMTLDEQATLS